MNKKISILLSAALTLITAADAATQRKVSIPAKPAQQLPPSMQAIRSTPHTPQERYLLPVLKQRLAAGSARGYTPSSPKSQAIGISGTAPNWGGFLSPAFYPTRLESSCVIDSLNCGVAVAVAADVDKDGKPDIVALQYDGTLNVLLNNGSGGFAAPVAYSNPNVSTSFILEGYAADVNNDGYPDFVALDRFNNNLLLYLNLKNGTFGTPTAITPSSGFGSVGSFAIGDVNNDGKLDVVTLASNTTVAYSNSTVAVQTYLGGGDGTFQTTANLTQTFTVAASVNLSGNLAVTLGDLNNDHFLDIAVVLEEYTQGTGWIETAGTLVATTALNKRDGSFGPLNATIPVSVPYAVTPDIPLVDIVTSGVQILDVNGDSNPDLLVDVSGSGATSVALVTALGDGSGGYSSVVQTPDPGANVQIVYTDVNGDGIPDAILENAQLQVWTGKGDGTFQIVANGASSDGSSYIVDGGGGQSIALADFNGDGNLDVAQLAGDYMQLAVFAGNGKGAFNGALALASTTDPTLESPLRLEDVADVQGKGYSSAIYLDFSGKLPQVVTGVSDGKGNFTYSVGLTSAAAPKMEYLQPVQADFNGDGKQDLLFVNTDNSVSVALSNGDGTFGAPKSLALPSLNCEPNYAAAGDLDKDGNIDVVLTYGGDASCGGSGGNVSGYFTALGKGDGTFQTPIFTAFGSELYSATLADMDLDGNLDLLLDDAPFQVGGTFAIYLLPGNGHGAFSPGTAVNSDYLVSQVIAGDYNGDGKPDLILLEEGEQSATGDGDITAGVLLLPGRGDGTFGDLSQLGSGDFFLNGALADVNGDGQPDLVLALFGTNGQPNTFYGLSTLLGEGGGAFSAPINTLESLQSISPFAGNFYDDNAPDFIVQTAYGIALFLGQGGTTFTLTDSAASITFGQAETFTATVAASMANRPAPTGTVSFYDGTTLLSAVPLSSSSASYSTSALATGSHSITAVYSGDGNFNPQSSTTTTQVVVSTLAPAFTLTSSSSSLSLSQGQGGVATLTLAANATFSGAVALTCSGAPANASCVVNPASVTLTPSGSTTATLAITTTAARAALMAPQRPWQSLPGSGTPVSLSLAALGLFAGWKWRKRWPTVLSLMILTISGISMTACGGSSPVKTATKGSYTITVTATPSGGSGSAQTATVAVTVQ
jgi:Bacterial Ig-like domain (group 3)/FG-GAP-like repeat